MHFRRPLIALILRSRVLDRECIEIEFRMAVWGYYWHCSVRRCQSSSAMTHVELFKVQIGEPCATTQIDTL